MVAEGLAAADGNFVRATELLSQCSVATYRGSIGQGIAVTTPTQFLNLSDNCEYLPSSVTAQMLSVWRPVDCCAILLSVCRLPA